MHTVVAGALVRDARILLVHRHPARGWYPDVWDLPGGHVEAGESPLAALARELHEELGVRVDPSGCRPAGEIVAPGIDPAESLHLRIWLVRSWAGAPVNRCPDEHDGIGWFAAADLAGLPLPHADEHALLVGLLGS